MIAHTMELYICAQPECEPGMEINIPQVQQLTIENNTKVSITNVITCMTACDLRGAAEVSKRRCQNVFYESGTCARGAFPLPTPRAVNTQIINNIESQRTDIFVIIRVCRRETFPILKSNTNTLPAESRPGV